MADRSPIEWTGVTWNPVVGCSIVSPGCTNCYAMRQARRIEAMAKGATHYAGTTRTVNGKPVWTGKLALAPDSVLTQPLRWSRARTIFVNSMSDLFHEDAPDDWIDRVFAIMALSPQHIFQVLTKRSARMRAYVAKISANPIPRLSDQIAAHMGAFAASMPVFRTMNSDAVADILARRIDPDLGGWPLPNVWLGVSAERQKEADERIPDLLATPAAVRFVSAEPLLGPIDFTSLCTGFYFADALNGFKYHDAPEGIRAATEACAKLDWVIVGGESGPDARPMHPDGVRSIRDQCADAGVAFFFKQWGGVNKKAAGRQLDGVEHNGLPAGREARS